MSKTSWKAGTMLYPLPPVLVTCGTLEKPNVFTVAWTGIINSDPAMTYISVRPSRYSYELIKQSKEFVINLPTAQILKETHVSHSQQQGTRPKRPGRPTPEKQPSGHLFLESFIY